MRFIPECRRRASPLNMDQRLSRGACAVSTFVIHLAGCRRSLPMIDPTDFERPRDRSLQQAWDIMKKASTMKNAKSGSKNGKTGASTSRMKRSCCGPLCEGDVEPEFAELSGEA